MGQVWGLPAFPTDMSFNFPCPYVHVSVILHELISRKKVFARILGSCAGSSDEFVSFSTGYNNKSFSVKSFFLRNLSMMKSLFGNMRFLSNWSKAHLDPWLDFSRTNKQALGEVGRGSAGLPRHMDRARVCILFHCHTEPRDFSSNRGKRLGCKFQIRFKLKKL